MRWYTGKKMSSYEREEWLCRDGPTERLWYDWLFTANYFRKIHFDNTICSRIQREKQGNVCKTGETEKTSELMGFSFDLE